MSEFTISEIKEMYDAVTAQPHLWKYVWFDSSQIKKAYTVCEVQFHKLIDPNNLPENQDTSEHARLARAFYKLNRLDLAVREKANEIFAQEGLADHGFIAGVVFSYDSKKDNYDK